MPRPPEGPTVFLMRSAKPEDAPTLLKLARMVHFINLPADKDIIDEKIRWSQACFEQVSDRVRPDGTLAPEASAGKPRHKKGSSRNGDAGGLATLNDRSKVFMFVLEQLGDGSTAGPSSESVHAAVSGDGSGGGGVLGTSQIITSMGGVGHPNLSFELKKKEMFSTSLQSGATHIVAKLKLDESGPTEIGGLILQPSYRGHKARLGRFLSIVRFHFMGLFRPVVADRVLAEMMGPITPDGQNTLWEYLGRRFINLTYTEADRFCQHSKEFMLSLLPREEIYLTLLPPEARSIIAQVGPETEPAKRMLEKLGFEYRNCVDPFDGGPNLEAATDDITIVKDTRRAVLGSAVNLPASENVAIVSSLDSEGVFRAVQAPFELTRRDARDGSLGISISPAHLEMLGASPGAVVGFTPLDAAAKNGPRTASAVARNGHSPSVKPRAGNKGGKARSTR